MFSYFESSVDGIIPNEYDTMEDICSDLYGFVGSARDSCMLTARRFWIANQQLVSPEFSKKIFQFRFNKDETANTQNHPTDSASSSKHANKLADKETLPKDKEASKYFNNINVTTKETKKHD